MRIDPRDAHYGGASLHDARHAASLFDGTLTTRGLQQVFARMWERALSDQSTDLLPAS